MSLQVGDYLEQFGQLGDELWRDGRGPILVAVAGGWFLSMGVRMIYPVVLPQLRGAYGFGLTGAGLLITTLWVAYALGQLPGGMLDDRLGGGRVLVASTAISAVALTLVVTAGSAPLLFGATVVFGFATALYGVARFTILTDYYPNHGGTAIGLTMGAGDLGNAILPPLAGAIAIAIAWQLGFGFAIPLFLFAAVGIYFAVPDDRRSASTTATRDREPAEYGLVDTLFQITRVLRRRPVAIVALIQTLGYCIWQAVTGFYPTYLVETKGIAPATATILFGTFFAMGIVVKPITGSIYDAYGLRRSLPLLMAAITAALVSLPLVEGIVGIVAVTVLASSVLGYGTITLTYLTNSLPDDVQGTGLGSIRTTYMLIGAGSPTVVGILADASYFDEAFFLLAAIGGIAAVLSLLVPEN